MPDCLKPPKSFFARPLLWDSQHLRRSLIMVMITYLLGGCAAQMAYRDGRDLVTQGKVEDGLAKFQQAIESDPHNPEYRSAYLQTRERALERDLKQADTLSGSGNRDDADKVYRRALRLDPSNERALAGLQLLDREARHEQRVKDGITAFDKKDIGLARQQITPVLAENPKNPAALALQQRITEATTNLPRETQLAAAYRKPISVEFRDIPLKQLFEVIARSSGLNFLFDKDVKTDQKTSIFLKNSTIEAAVHFSLLSNQLESQVLDANTILIYPNTAAKIKDYQEMVIRSFFLTNADAKVVANTLKTIIKSRDIVIDEKLNMLIVRDSPDAIKLAEKLVALHDVAEPEVMLEVEILEVKRTRMMELGIQWPNSLSLTPLSLSTTPGSALTLQALRGQNSATLGAGIGPVTLKARTEDSDAKLLANPRIRTRNHEKAKILIGERVPNITSTATSTGFVSESINYVDVGLTLNVEPTIYLDNDVAIKIQMEVSNIVSQIKTQSGTVAYQIGTRTASTVLRLKDGETQVLAGLINDEDRRAGNKVPGLGELPLVGRLFGSFLDDNQKTEIVLSITPHLIRNIRRPDAGDAQFSSGTDSSFRNRPENFSTTPATGLPNPIAMPMAPPVVPLANPAISAPPFPNAPMLPAAPTALAGFGAQAAAPAAPAGFNGGFAGAPAGASDAARMDWQGPASVRVGDSFAVTLLLQSDAALTGVPLTLGYDPQVLEVVGITEDVFLKQGGAQTTFTSAVAPGGQVRLAGARSGAGGATNLAGFATVNFRALTAAEASKVQVTAINPVGLAGRVIAMTPGAAFSVKVAP